MWTQEHEWCGLALRANVTLSCGTNTFQEVFDSMAKEPDGIGCIHDVFSSAPVSSVFPKDVERLWLHPRWFPMWLRDSFYFLFLVTVGLRHLAIVMHLVPKKSEHLPTVVPGHSAPSLAPPSPSDCA